MGSGVKGSEEGGAPEESAPISEVDKEAAKPKKRKTKSRGGKAA